MRSTAPARACVGDPQPPPVSAPAPKQRPFALTHLATLVGSRSPQEFRLRWFTPTVEVNLCGHATLATAAALFFEVGNESDRSEPQYSEKESIRPTQAPTLTRSPSLPTHHRALRSLTFHTRSGPLVVSRDASSASRRPALAMQFPANLPARLWQAPGWESDAFGRDVRGLLDDRCPAEIQAIVGHLVGPAAELREIWYSAETKKLVVSLPDGTDPAVLRDLKPDIRAAHAVDQTRLSTRITGVSVTIFSHESRDRDARGAAVAVPRGVVDKDFVSRYFAPWNGIDEDPVNGSSHTILGPLFATRVLATQERDMDGARGAAEAHTADPFEVRLEAAMLSPRGGDLGVRVPLQPRDEHAASDDRVRPRVGERVMDATHVFLLGNVVTVAGGTLRVE